MKTIQFLKGFLVGMWTLIVAVVGLVFGHHYGKLDVMYDGQMKFEERRRERNNYRYYTK